ncbi:MAG: sigma-54-dependent Fis family transcriptional regulator [Nitrospina sp.]|jgi:transcriptional regulator with GAF, ATPase, and Fis domain|nr:sigma-54-dependent Fis family transcriptional regulator [Nitrospina sp.]MBT3510475.1 sigma-54-dependent Fis family transcriptional regulator [Nitrospina sp.]MBT3875764.1 sigma-54-dependent Fis family transcriptional regulator [Nitrospina sp.]MBT4049211.1 sigma-54-dependent Fis family transcriptional regulator [Nitrospina sp.]MBT4557180.1 sigma-54-dependent Fis family transcriptional regulator [Nitrospina sp.]
MPLKSSHHLISRFGKESLPEILHHIATRLKKLYDCKMVRINLEDLYEGMLVCQYVTDQNPANEQPITKFISPEASIISQAFLNNEVVFSWNWPDGFAKTQNPFEKLAGIKATAVFPITHQFRPIGTISLDWGKVGEFLDEEQKKNIVDFLADASGTIDRAKRFHQKLSFSRHLDMARKKEAAWMMMRSAVQLIDKLALASVWVPSSIKDPKSNSTSNQIEILAAFSKNRDDALIYNNRDHINIHKENLINRVVLYDKEKGLIAKDRNLKAVYIEDVMEESFSRKAVARKIDLVSLYQVPKINPKTGQLICMVNYYTNTSHKFTNFEKPLLENHADMVEKLILEENPEHVEIEVLSEIEELLSDADDNMGSFLDKILAKTSELIDADSGTISIHKILDGKPWLIIEDKEGNLVGAKSRGWMKSKIPLLPVGGEELSTEQRSLNGFVAHSARPVLISNVEDIKQTRGFYKNLSGQIKSALAVPIIHGSHVLGVINQDSFQKNYFTQEHQRILQIIASLISQKVNNLLQIETLKQELLQLRKDIEYRDPKVSSYHFGNVIGKSHNINSLVNQIQTVVESICNRMLSWEGNQQRETMTGLPSLLIQGQTGSGKEFFFNNIYSHLNDIFQKEKGTHFKIPLRKTNIAAYSGELTYSELFGHKKGAFTGAEFNRQGILEEANGGVVFLDEIGDADPRTQVQLLRFLDTGVFMRLGENQPRISKIFLIAATNKNLLEEIQEGRFREDLYHRLNALSFQIPRLNEREEDIEDLATHFLGILYSSYKKEGHDPSPPQLDPGAVEYLKQHQYRGNVRELKNILLRAMLFRKGPLITKDEITSACRPSEGAPTSDRDFIETLLSQFETGEANFWTNIHQPFKANHLTRDTVKSLIIAAKNRYQTNLPGLAVKLGACKTRSHLKLDERKKFISFKNFLYKTVKISSN